MFKWESNLLGPIRLNQSCCPLIVIPSDEVSAYIRPWSPGDMAISIKLQSEQLLPGAGVRDPLQAAVPGSLSAEYES